MIQAVNKQEGESFLNLHSDLPPIEQYLKTNENVNLLIIDPLSAYLGQTNTFQDSQVRSILSPLCKMAETYGVAVIGILHLNKDERKRSAINRTGGSIGFIAAARTAFLISKDKEAETETEMVCCNVLCIKTNIGRLPHGLNYSIAVNDDERPYIEWTVDQYGAIVAVNMTMEPLWRSI